MRALGIVGGIDCAVNHAAVVVARVLAGEDGPVFRDCKAFVATNRDKNLKLTSPQMEVTKVPSKLLDDLSDQLYHVKLAFWSRFYTQIRKSTDLALVGIEDYATSASQGSHQIGSCSGIARASFIDCPLRAIPISAIKSAGAGSGGAEKSEVALGIARELMPELALLADDLDEGVKDQDRDSHYDVFDAATITIILGWELWVRENAQAHKAPAAIRRELLRVNSKGKSPPVSQEMVSPLEILDTLEERLQKKRGRGKR